MKRQKRSNQEKAKIVLEYLKTGATAEICNRYGIHQNQLYGWRDRFLENAPKAFTVDKASLREANLINEIKNLKSLVGELTLELKKMENEY